MAGLDAVGRHAALASRHRWQWVGAAPLGVTRDFPAFAPPPDLRTGGVPALTPGVFAGPLPRNSAPRRPPSVETVATLADSDWHSDEATPVPSKPTHLLPPKLRFEADADAQYRRAYGG